MNTASAQNLANIEGGEINYAEGGDLVQITNTLTVGGNNALVLATLTFESGYDANEDTLIYEGETVLYPVFNEEAGRLLLLSYPAGSTRTSEEMQTALRSVFYYNTNEENPKIRGRKLTINVTNEDNTVSNTVSRNIAIRRQNDPPILRSPSNSPIVVNTLRNEPVVSDLIVSDPDNNTMAGATVNITQSRFGDELGFSDDNGDNIKIQKAGGDDGSLVLSGEDTRENYQKALRGITITNPFTPVGFTGNRLVVMQITDENGAESRPFSQYVHVRNQGSTINVPPSVQDIAASGEENEIITFQLQQFQQAYDDEEQTPFEFIRILSLPEHGFLTVDGTVIDADFLVNDDGIIGRSNLNKLTYTPNSDFTGKDFFEWNATDGSEFAANAAYITITINPTPIPLAIDVPESAQVDEDGTTTLPSIALDAMSYTPLNVSLSVGDGQIFINPIILPFLNFSDDSSESGETQAFTATAQVTRYVLSGLQYQPNTNVAGSDLLNISVSSSNESEEDILSITIIPIDDPIVLSDIEPDTLIYQENSSFISITDSLTLSDPDGAAVVLSATVTVSEGFDASQDTLAYDLTGGITAQQQDNQLLFSGEGSLSQYQTVLRSLAYQNNSEDPTGGLRRFEFTATDENDSSSNIVTRFLLVVPVDDSTLLATDEPGALNYVLGSDSVALHPTLTVTDVDTDSLTRMVISFEAGYDSALDTLSVEIPEGMTSSWDEDSGRLLIEGKNSLEVYQTIVRSIQYFNSSLEAQPERQISIQAFNSKTPSNSIVRTIQLVENEPPTVSSFDKKLVQNDSASFSIDEFLTYYTDPDNFPAVDQFSSIRIVSLPEQGVLTIANDTITQDEIDAAMGGYFVSNENIAQLYYWPATDYTGADQFDWNAFDGAELASESATVTLTIEPALTLTIVTDSVEICPGETAELAIEVLTGESPTYSWTCDREDCRITTASDGPAISVNPIETTHYIFRVESSEGLDAIQDTITVTVPDCSGIALEIPTAFTPNQDNINDQWVFPNAAIFSSIRVEVYDRYGQTVFQSNNYQNNWDGTYEGKKLPTGTYYYQVVVNQGLQERTGTVTLLQ
uniref:Gliding motility-associated C-terminal domain-containing protein n=1 Tax=Roseihalotalea indica TaxID=2867963 RepID=A0AA49JEJ0_9BACT|nr:gliding motility-associated C-terminal domain-containing protein [Tunicatimonas sp. TK19036]